MSGEGGEQGDTDYETDLDEFKVGVPKGRVGGERRGYGS